jgi:hypothetical protein
MTVATTEPMTEVVSSFEDVAVDSTPSKSVGGEPLVRPRREEKAEF